MDSSTVIRQVNMTTMMLGPNGPAADRIASSLEESHVRVVRVVHVVEACERLAVVMPQVVLVLGALRADERDALDDRVTAVGALILDVDPRLDDDALSQLTLRTAATAIERRMRLEEAGRPRAAASEPPDEEDVDSKW